MTAQVSWHVQHLAMITWLGFELEQNISIDLNYEQRNRQLYYDWTVEAQNVACKFDKIIYLHEKFLWLNVRSFCD